MIRGAVLVMLAACAAPEPVRPVKPMPQPLIAPTSAPRLPRDFRPVGYRVQLRIGDQLAGHVEITGDLSRSTNLIWLDGDQLRVSAARAIREGQSIDLDVARTRWPARPTEVLALRAASPLAAGQWTLVLDYTAPIALQPVTGDPEQTHDATEHVFRETVGGKSYVFTDFEPMGARRAFPCVDEPDAKVPWQLTLDVEADATAASNTPIVRELPLPNGRKRVEFAATPPLPSYLVAFAVGPFEIIPGPASQRGVPIRILVPQGQLAQKLAAETAGRALDLEEAWFGTPYPYAKLDLVAVPVTGEPSIAMENPGLVTYRADLVRDHEEWTYTLLHELAHQWFGNLVTPAWWSDIWLNEGFATWLATKLAPSLDPEIVPQRPFAFRDDVLSTPPRDLVAIRPATGLFSPALRPYFSSWHGAALVQMLEHDVGAEVFHAAILDHLARHAGKTATTAELVESLDRHSHMLLGPVVDEFLDHPRPPSLSYALSCRDDHSVLALQVYAPGQWKVPVCFAYESDGKRAEQCVTVDSGGNSFPLSGRGCARWAFPDVGATGFYRLTTSTPAELMALVDVGWPFLTSDERASLFPETDRIFTSKLAFVSHLVATSEPEALQAAARIVDAFLDQVPDDIRPELDRWILQHFSAVAEALHFKATTIAQRALIRIVGAARDPALLAQAASLVDRDDELDLRQRAPVEGLAMVRDPSVVVRLADRARASKSSDALARALRFVPERLALFEHQAGLLDLLTVSERTSLLVTCDPTARARAVALANQSLGVDQRAEVSSRSEACAKLRTENESELRAWVSSLTPTAAPASTRSTDPHTAPP